MLSENENKYGNYREINTLTGSAINDSLSLCDWLLSRGKLLTGGIFCWRKKEMIKAGRKALSLVLSVYMALSVGASDLSIASYAAEKSEATNHLWTKVKLEDI